MRRKGSLQELINPGSEYGWSTFAFAGNDALDGGADRDRVSYDDATSGVTLKSAAISSMERPSAISAANASN